MVSNIVGPPVRGSNCYGREVFVDLVWQKLRAGHVLLAAPRPFGKTSVMYRLIDAPQWECKLIHADLEHLLEPAELLAQLVVELAKDIEKPAICLHLSLQRKRSRIKQMAGFSAFIRSNLCTRHIQKKLRLRGHHDWPVMPSSA